MESLSLPIHKGYYVEDLRTLDLGYWAERECKTAFLQLAGQEGVTESRVSEIPPGTTLPPVRFAMDEVVYVVEGRGLTSVWRGGAKDPQTFEWQKHSMFLLPRNTTFASELAKRGLESIMPEQAYADRDFEWDYEEDK